MLTNPRQVFIGYHEIAGFCGSLEAALSTVGAKPHFCELLQNKYYEPRNSTTIEYALRCHISRQYAGLLGPVIRRLNGFAIKFLFFVELLIRYDSFIFVGIYSPLGLGERAILRALGKRVVSVFLGSDSRPAYQNGAMLDRYGKDWSALKAATRQQLKEVRVIERGSDEVVCHVLCSHFLSKPFARFLSLGFPFDEKRLETTSKALPRRSDDDSIRVVHAPSSPRFKGTLAIVKAIDELKAEGIPIDFDLLQNLPNREVLMALSSCDFVVDELYSDSPLAGLAVEAAVFGKPSIIGTYAKPDEFAEHALPPSILCHPSSIKESIRIVATNKVARESLGFGAQQYLRTKWSLREVGGRFLKLIEGGGEPEWYSDPKDTTYIYGWGIELEELRHKLRAFVVAGGEAVLCLEDKPRCLAVFKSFIYGSSVTDLNPLKLK